MLCFAVIISFVWIFVWIPYPTGYDRNTVIPKLKAPVVPIGGDFLVHCTDVTWASWRLNSTVCSIVSSGGHQRKHHFYALLTFWECHYMNQCWNVVNWTLGNKFKWNFHPITTIFVQENALDNVVWKMAAILSRPQRVKDRCASIVTKWNIQENALENIVWKMMAILSRSQCVKDRFALIVTKWNWDLFKKISSVNSRNMKSTTQSRGGLRISPACTHIMFIITVTS